MCRLNPIIGSQELAGVGGGRGGAPDDGLQGGGGTGWVHCKVILKKLNTPHNFLRDDDETIEGESFLKR